MTKTDVNFTEQLTLAANAIRVLAMDAVQQANSGHPGMPMGMADAAALLWSHYLKFNPTQPNWWDRDRFVLSAGHGSMLLYALLHLSGYELSLDDLKNFRQWGSRTPGHPEYGHTIGVETTTGPLGQGMSTAVGMALAERWLAARFNHEDMEIVNHRTFVIAGDGDLMEGISHEAASLAGHLGLGRLIVLYDDNGISIDGSTDLSFTEDVLKRFEAYNWQIAQVDGHDMQALQVALDAAIADEARPSLIACKTIIGYGSPNLAGTSKTHGAPLGADEIQLTKEHLGLATDEAFSIPEMAGQTLLQAGKQGAKKYAMWQGLLAEYKENYPESAQEFTRIMNGELPVGWDSNMPDFDKPIATRAASGKILDSIIENLPELLGGSADLTGSNKTRAKGLVAVSKDKYDGRYIHYGVREHAMGAIMNGLALHGGFIPFGGTFLVFSDYMRGAIRLSALMGQGVVHVFTHDSIGLGEDGPTHQPIEHLAALRAIPNLTVIRPADAYETIAAWKVAIENRGTPTALILTRQNLPLLPPEKTLDLAKGAYIISDAENPQAIVIGTGSELHIALDAQAQLAAEGIAVRVVSMPSMELFNAMPKNYRDEILPPSIDKRVAIEAATTFGWERYVGLNGRVIGLDHFGASAPYETLYEAFGLTAEAVITAVKEQL